MEGCYTPVIISNFNKNKEMNVCALDRGCVSRKSVDETKKPLTPCVCKQTQQFNWPKQGKYLNIFVFNFLSAFHSMFLSPFFISLFLSLPARSFPLLFFSLGLSLRPFLFLSPLNCRSLPSSGFSIFY